MNLGKRHFGVAVLRITLSDLIHVNQCVNQLPSKVILFS